MTLGQDMADKIQNRVKWDKIIEEIDWKEAVEHYGPDVENILLQLRDWYPGWFFETMTVRGLALMLQDRGFKVREESRYYAESKDC